MREIPIKWEDINWAQVHADVFQMQKRIFRKSKENRRTEMHSLQRLLVKSTSARCLAVRKAAMDSRGKKTAGVDMVKNLSGPQMRRLANELSLRQRPQPVRRTTIPKPGSSELRPLGIPTIADRALQHLIVLALEPEWEAHFAPHQFGFRRGYACHDALINIRRHVQRCPKWVLDADIEKFFDRLSHSALLEKLDTWSQMKTVIARILKAGAMDGNILVPTEVGTPQGGPLSPCLANIALSGLEPALMEAARAGGLGTRLRISNLPRIVLYADDFVVLHEQRQVVEAARTFIGNWLLPLGLNLSASKTRIIHTLERVDGQQAGFDFLGCRVQQFRVGKREATDYFKGIWTQIRPSNAAIKELLLGCRDIIQAMGPYKKRNAEYQNRERKGQLSPIEVMIAHLNRSIRGWCRYHCLHNAKEKFARVDHELYGILWQWAKRTFPQRGRYRLAEDLWLAKGRPWTFRDPNPPVGKDPRELYKAASTPIEKHIPIKAGRSFYDGDWAYWGSRSGLYPTLPWKFGFMLKRQRGKCAHCKESISCKDRATVVQKQVEGKRAFAALIHEKCDDRSNDAAQGSERTLGAAISSPVHGDVHAGF